MKLKWNEMKPNVRNCTPVDESQILNSRKATNRILEIIPPSIRAKF